MTIDNDEDRGPKTRAGKAALARVRARRAAEDADHKARLQRGLAMVRDALAKDAR